MKRTLFTLLLAVLALGTHAFAGSYTIDFENLSDGTLVGNNYSSFGVIFQNAAIATAGISLNEFEFPPHSGINVAFDALGPITLIFTTPVSSFSAYFTYAEPLTMTAYNAQNQIVGTATSLFSANYVSSGNPPNELIGLSSLGGITSLLISADPLGDSFTMDDASFTQLVPVSEPGILYILLPAVGIIVSRKLAGRLCGLTSDGKTYESQ